MKVPMQLWASVALATLYRAQAAPGSAAVGRRLAHVQKGSRPAGAALLAGSRRSEPSAQTCHEDASSEYCPADKSCKPDSDCTGCPGFNVLDNKTHTCNQNPPELVRDMCGDDPGRPCYQFSLETIGCLTSCYTQFNKPNAQGLFGACMTGTQAGCPLPLCIAVCECEGPPEKQNCKEPCMQRCSKYKSCVNNGSGKAANVGDEFVNIVDQCVFGKPAPELPDGTKVVANCGGC